jgi:addiction module HigA family antidote
VALRYTPEETHVAMINPSHPGSVLRESMADKITISALAKHVGVTREHLSTILNERAGVSPLMSLKLDEAFGTSAGLRYKMQANYDLAEARRVKRAKVRPLFRKTA